MLAIVGERFREVTMAVIVEALVRARPLWGRMEWLERAFSIGQGDRTSSSPGGDHLVQSMGGWSAGGSVDIVDRYSVFSVPLNLAEVMKFLDRRLLMSE